MKDNNMYELQPSMYDISTSLKEKFNSELLNRLHSYDDGKRLRTYAMFKQAIRCEPYLRLVQSRKHWFMLSKFRPSSHDLEIEWGRYGRKSTKPEQRHCKICQANKTHMMGNEFHFFMICPMYKTKRDIMLGSIYASFPNVKCLDLQDQFIWLMSQEK